MPDYELLEPGFYRLRSGRIRFRVRDASRRRRWVSAATLDEAKAISVLAKSDPPLPKVRPSPHLDAVARARLQLAQNDRCACCRDKTRLFVDHDHKTGHVRGLLCVRCNFMLGHAMDDPARLAAGIDYLARPPAAAASEHDAGASAVQGETQA